MQSCNPQLDTSLDAFDALKLHACKIVGYVYCDAIVMPCEESLATFWSIFGRYKKNSGYYGLERLEDYPTKAEAQRALTRLTDTHPNLASDSLVVKHQRLTKLASYGC